MHSEVGEWKKPLLIGKRKKKESFLGKRKDRVLGEKIEF